VQGGGKCRVRLWVDDDRITCLPNDDGVTRTAVRQVADEDLAHFRAAPADWRVTVGLLEATPQDLLIKKLEELVKFTGVERGAEWIASHPEDYSQITQSDYR
jgi:hypothetical protein